MPRDTNEPTPATSPESIVPSQELANDLGMPSMLVMDPDVLKGCNTSRSSREIDASSDSTSPITLQQYEIIESYLTENVSHSKYPQAGKDAGAWTSNDGTQDLCQPLSFMLQRSVFVPYVRIFLQRLYPVFPVVDREALLQLLRPEEQEEEPISVGLYAFLAALSAAVIVQLNAADLGAFATDIPELDGHGDLQWVLNPQPAFSAQFFVAQCMQARQQQEFIEDPDEWTILTSFFLFAYHGNMALSRSAWYYLREAIGFVQALRLDEANAYKGLRAEIEQRRKRLFWLLFITERAYAIQHRRRTVLKPTIDLPRVFESGDPKLAYGFVTLAKVFATVDEVFIAAWANQPVLGGVGIPQQTSQSIAKLLKHDDVSGVLSVSEIDETQRLDILATQHWLRILACRLQRELSPEPTLIKDKYEGFLQNDLTSNTRRVLDTSRSLLHVITSATPTSLEPHGIGMEQKISDVANCLCDILASLDVDDFYTGFFSAPDYLHNFMVFLAGFRNHESQYLRPLAQRASTVLAARLQPMAFPEVTDEERRMSGSVDLQRSECMSEGANL